jgi:hypothetical protein
MLIYNTSIIKSITDLASSVSLQSTDSWVVSRVLGRPLRGEERTKSRVFGSVISSRMLLLPERFLLAGSCRLGTMRTFCVMTSGMVCLNRLKSCCRC